MAVTSLVSADAVLAAREQTVIDVTITGLTNMLQHKGTTITKTKSQTRAQAQKSYAEEWKQTAYLDDDGYVCVPDLNIEASILQAGKTRKLGSLRLKKYLAYAVVVEPSMPRLKVDGKFITLDDVAKNDWIFVTGAVVQKSRIDRARVMLPAGRWTLDFNIGLDQLVIKPPTLLDVLNDAGRTEGLCDWRPGSPIKPGKFGQFYVSRFDVHD